LWKEIDADIYSVKILKATGYDPAVSLRVLSKLMSNGMGQSSTLEIRLNTLISILGY
jgi:predicted Zn-dependent protease